MQNNRRSVRFISALLIAIFVNFMFSNIVFMHLHTLPDGSHITHSHPYVPAENHSHSGNSLSLISSFNGTSVAFQGVAPFLCNFLSIVEDIKQNFSVVAYLNPLIEYASLRAPPVL